MTRHFIGLFATLLLGLLWALLAAGVQPARKVPLVGVLVSDSPPSA